MIESKGIKIDALSGISGRGHGLSVESLYSEANENANAYGLLTHRHTGEIEFSLSHVYGSAVEVLFTPHLVPMTRYFGYLPLNSCRRRANFSAPA